MGRPSSKEVGVLRYGMTSHDMARYGTVMAFCCRRHHGFIFVLLYVHMYLSSIHTHTIFGYIYINFYILPRVPSRVNALPRKKQKHASNRVGNSTSGRPAPCWRPVASPARWRDRGSSCAREDNVSCRVNKTTNNKLASSSDAARGCDGLT